MSSALTPSNNGGDGPGAARGGRGLHCATPAPAANKQIARDILHAAPDKVAAVRDLDGELGERGAVERDEELAANAQCGPADGPRDTGLPHGAGDARDVARDVLLRVQLRAAAELLGGGPARARVPAAGAGGLRNAGLLPGRAGGVRRARGGAAVGGLLGVHGAREAVRERAARDGEPQLVPGAAGAGDRLPDPRAGGLRDGDGAAGRGGAVRVEAGDADLPAARVRRGGAAPGGQAPLRAAAGRVGPRQLRPLLRRRRARRREGRALLQPLVPRHQLLQLRRRHRQLRAAQPPRRRLPARLLRPRRLQRPVPRRRPRRPPARAVRLPQARPRPARRARRRGARRRRGGPAGPRRGGRHGGREGRGGPGAGPRQGVRHDHPGGRAALPGLEAGVQELPAERVRPPAAAAEARRAATREPGAPGHAEQGLPLPATGRHRGNAVHTAVHEAGAGRFQPNRQGHRRGPLQRLPAQ